MVSNDFLITSNAAIFAAWSTLVERSANFKPLLGGKCAREERLCGFSSFPVDFPQDFAPLAFSLGIQALGESISLATLIFSFSELTSKALLTIWLISGVDSSVGKLYAEEEFATDIVLDTIITIRFEKQWLAVDSLISRLELTEFVREQSLM